MSNGEEQGKAEISNTRRKYIPHLAEFYFEPSFDWANEEAKIMYNHAGKENEHLPLNHVIYEDCIIGMKSLPEKSIDLVIADPPFGIDFNGKSSVYNRDETYVVDGYEEIAEGYDEFSEAWIREAFRILAKDGTAYIFSGWNNLEDVLRGGRNAGLHLLNHIVWNFPFGVYTKKRFVTSHYHILLFVKDPDNYFFNKIENYPQDVWRIKRKYRMGREKNSTKLPLEVVQKCIDFSSKPGDVILDPFIGNGTTAVAAKGCWRHFVGFEVNNKLQDVIETAVKKVQQGQFYTSYKSRLPSVEDLAKKYPNAYKAYLEKEGKNKH